jgi:hypothetical protein
VAPITLASGAKLRARAKFRQRHRTVDLRGAKKMTFPLRREMESSVTELDRRHGHYWTHQQTLGIETRLGPHTRY